MQTQTLPTFPTFFQPQEKSNPYEKVIEFLYYETTHSQPPFIINSNSFRNYMSTLLSHNYSCRSSAKDLPFAKEFPDQACLLMDCVSEMKANKSERLANVLALSQKQDPCQISFDSFFGDDELTKKEKMLFMTCSYKEDKNADLSPCSEENKDNESLSCCVEAIPSPKFIIYHNENGGLKITFPKAPLALSFSGGGAKGTGYLGVIGALDEQGMLAYVRESCGTSAGSIISAALSCGTDYTSLKCFQKCTNMQTVILTKTLESQIDGFLCFVVTQKINENAEIKEGKLSYDKMIKKACEVLTEKEQKRFCSVIRAIKEKGLKKITFGELEAIRKVLPFSGIKPLCVNGTTVDYSPLIFSAGITPDIPIALACFTSSSLPIPRFGTNLQDFFPEVPTEVEHCKDGGLFDNNPFLMMLNTSLFRALILFLDSNSDIENNMETFDIVHRTESQGFAEVKLINDSCFPARMAHPYYLAEKLRILYKVYYSDISTTNFEVVSSPKGADVIEKEKRNFTSFLQRYEGFSTQYGNSNDIFWTLSDGDLLNLIYALEKEPEKVAFLSSPLVSLSQEEASILRNHILVELKKNYSQREELTKIACSALEILKYAKEQDYVGSCNNVVDMFFENVERLHKEDPILCDKELAYLASKLVNNHSYIRPYAIKLLSQKALKANFASFSFLVEEITKRTSEKNFIDKRYYFLMSYALPQYSKLFDSKEVLQKIPESLNGIKAALSKIIRDIFDLNPNCGSLGDEKLNKLIASAKSLIKDAASLRGVIKKTKNPNVSLVFVSHMEDPEDIQTEAGNKF